MNKRLSKEKQALVLAALCEGTPINAVGRMFRVGKHAILRVIRETGEAFADYMDSEFRDLSCTRIEMDEQWQYVGCHAGRMPKRQNLWEPKDKTRGDFWLWACIDADTKLVFSHKVGKRTMEIGRAFVEDVHARVKGRSRSRLTISSNTLGTLATCSGTKATATGWRQRFLASRSC
jgi:hypothetical protein